MHNVKLKRPRTLQKASLRVLPVLLLLLPTRFPRSTSLLLPTPASSAPGLRELPSYCISGSSLSATSFSGSTEGAPRFWQEKYRDSDLILYIGNLDWSVPSESYLQLFTDIITNDSNNVGNERDKIVKSSTVMLPTINIKKSSNRPRDRGKCHGGSATITFETNQAAQAGKNALLNYADFYKKDFRIRWARLPVTHKSIRDGGAIPRAKLKKNSNKQLLTAEQVQRRMERAESYARKRQRVAQKTDDILSTVLATTDDDRAADTTEAVGIKRMMGILHLHGNDAPVECNRDDARLIKNRSIRLPVLDAPLLDWSSCPSGLDPLQGGGLVRNARGLRKQAAVEAFSFVVREALLDSTRSATSTENTTNHWVADLGCGAGNLALPLAWQLREIGCNVVGVDFNQKSLDRLMRRATEASLKVETLNLDLLELINDMDAPGIATALKKNDYYLQNCAAVVSLHACGAASDLSMVAAVRHSLPFAMSPCCIGKVNTIRKERERTARISLQNMPPMEPFKRRGAPEEIEYPRSAWLRKAVPLPEDFRMLASAADYGVNSSSDDIQELMRRRRCQSAKRIIEADRLEWARENGYYVRLLELPRIGPFYPKRELLLGAKDCSKAADRIRLLPTSDVQLLTTI